MLFALFLVVLNYYPVLTLILLTCLQLTSIFLKFRYNPYSTIIYTVIEIINEILMILFYVCCFMLSGIETSELDER